jgi:hypothetical protein
MTIDDITGEMIAKTKNEYKNQQSFHHTSKYENQYNHDLYGSLSTSNKYPTSSSLSSSSYVNSTNNKNQYSSFSNNSLLNRNQK